MYIPHSQLGQLLALQQLGMTFGYVICAIGPVMVSSAIAHFYYGEIRPGRDHRFFAAALAAQALGVALIAVG